MTPTHETLLTGVTTWFRRYRGLGLEVKFWGASEIPPGVWNAYIICRQPQFAKKDWRKMTQTRTFFGSHVSHDYDSGPWQNIDFHGGATFGELTKYYATEGREHQMVKVGCDYAHLWDKERGNPETLETVFAELERSADRLLELHPILKEEVSFL